MCNAHNHDINCTCGWGGDGHSGISANGYGRHISPRKQLTFERISHLIYTELDYCSYAQYQGNIDDFCKPTFCDMCGNPIFFIRHNGGSVWLDALGLPWPKHPCYYQDSQQSLSKSYRIVSQDGPHNIFLRSRYIESSNNLYNMLQKLSLENDDSSLGMILSAGTDSTGKILTMDILLMNKIVAPITVYTGFDGYKMRVKHMVGELVYFHFHEKSVQMAQYKWKFKFKVRTGTLSLNSRYEHPAFGQGTLIKETQSCKDVLLTFKFDKYGIKKIAFCSIPLVRINE